MSRRERRMFGSVRRLSSGRWQVRYRDLSGVLHTGPHTFTSKADAARYLAMVEADLHRGAWTDPKLGRITLAEWAKRWQATTTNLRPTTRDLYAYLLRRFLLPTFGKAALSSIDPLAVRDWLTNLQAEQLSPSTVAKAYRLLSRILGAAVEAGYLPRNPCTVKGAGQERAPEMRFATVAQGAALADAIDPRYRALVLVAALTGMRWGELIALRWDDPRFDQPLDDGAVLGPGRLRIARAISDPRRIGRGMEKGPKTEAGKRVIALDQETVQVFLAHRELVGGGPYDRIFTSLGGSRGPAGTLVHRNFIRVWKRALAKAELAHLWPEYGGLHFHDLRHTHATWLIAQRVPMIAVAGRLGHAKLVDPRPDEDDIDRAHNQDQDAEGQDYRGCHGDLALSTTAGYGYSSIPPGSRSL
jgi:integrase